MLLEIPQYQDKRKRVPNHQHKPTSIMEHIAEFAATQKAARRQVGDGTDAHRKPITVNVDAIGDNLCKQFNQHEVIANTGNCLQFMSLRDYDVGRHFSPHWRAPTTEELRTMRCVRA